MGRIILRAFIIMLLVITMFLGMFCAIKVFEVIDYSLWFFCILMFFDGVLLFTIDRIILKFKKDPQINITNLSDYRTLFMFIESFLIGFGGFFVTVILSGILGILFMSFS